MTKQTPPNSKSHYFVQNYDLEDGYKVCRICNKKFKPSTRKRIYCSDECYKKALKVTQKRWYQQNRERLIAKQIEYEKNKRPPPKLKISNRKKGKLAILEYKKCIIIKRELIKKELLSYQLLNRSVKYERRKKHSFMNCRHGVNEEKVEFIKNKLKELDLPKGYSVPVDFGEEPEIDVREPKVTNRVKCLI